MSSTVTNSPTQGNYQATETAKQEAEKFMEQVAPPATPQLEAFREWKESELQRDKEDLARQNLLGGGQSFAEGYGADDEESAKTMRGIKQGAHKAGVVLSDKTLHNVSAVTANDPATAKLVDKLADPQNPETQQLVGQLQGDGKADLSMFSSAYAASPAAQLSEAEAPFAPIGANATPPGESIAAGASTGTTRAAATPGNAQANAAGAPAAGTAGAAASGTTGAAKQTGLAGGTTPTSTPATAGKASAKASAGIQTGPGHLPGGNWSAFVAMAMFKATKEMQIEKKNELNQIKKFNSMLDQVNKYVTDVLMPAQQELQTMTANSKAKGGDLGKLQVTIYGAINPDTTNANWDPNTGTAILLNAPGSPEPPPAQKVTQTTLSSMIDNANQWRTSISNNQQLHSSDFQSLDTQVTSFLNMITSLYKNVNETQTGITRNLPT